MGSDEVAKSGHEFAGFWHRDVIRFHRAFFRAVLSLLLDRDFQILDRIKGIAARRGEPPEAARFL
jgi:hypothetical protein